MRISTFVTGVIALLFPVAAEAAELKLDKAPASRFIEADVHLLGGAGSVTQNYGSMIPRLENLNVDMGANLGIGARAVFGIREYLGVGTAIDFTYTNYNIDMLVLGDTEPRGMSTVYITNRIYRLTVPVFASLRFQVDKSVRWNIDAGFYYSYGLGGRQKQKIFRGEINSLGELVTERVNISTPYYHSADTYINVFNRGDIGLHLATSLNFGPHLIVGTQFQIGFKNAARYTGVYNPNVHNLTLNATLGYRF